MSPNGAFATTPSTQRPPSMKSSQDRIFTTHVGSLPRSDAVLQLLEERESQRRVRCRAVRPDRSARPYWISSSGRSIPASTSSATAKPARSVTQPTSTIGWPAFPTREVRNRPSRMLDVAPFPDFRQKMAQLTGARRFKRVACVGPIAVQDREALARDLANMRAAVDAAGPTEAFLTAASPGVVASFLPNQYYRLPRGLYRGHRGRDAGGVRSHRCGGLRPVRSIVPISPCPGTPAFQDLTGAEFLKRAAFHVDVLNHALAKMSRGQGSHARVLGQLRGPAHPRHRFRQDRRRSFSAPGRKALRWKPQIPATRTNGRCGRRSSFPTTSSCFPA